MNDNDSNTAKTLSRNKGSDIGHDGGGHVMAVVIAAVGVGGAGSRALTTEGRGVIAHRAGMTKGRGETGFCLSA